MLSLTTGRSRPDCDGIGRRDFLQIGTLGLGGLTLSQLLSAQAAAAAQGEQYVRDKSVVLLYLSGGASHIETFDPKMTAPDGIRSVTGEVKTSLPGVTFGGTFPRLATHADKLAVIRSFTHGVGSHEQAHVHVLSGGTDPQGRQADGFSMGSAFTRLRGTNHPVTGMPTYALLTEKEIDGQYRKELGRVIKGSWPGQLGQQCGPLRHEIGWDTSDQNRSSNQTGNDNPLAANMRLNMPRETFDNRLALLRSIDKLNRRLDANGSMEAADEFSAQAVNLILGGAANAFNYQLEDPGLVERYDTSEIKIGFKVFRPSTLGKQMLVARRLCEAGCGFVTVHTRRLGHARRRKQPGHDHRNGNVGTKLGQSSLRFSPRRRRAWIERENSVGHHG